MIVIVLFDNQFVAIDNCKIIQIKIILIFLFQIP